AQELDVLHRLPQIVEDGGAAIKQGATIVRRLDALPAAVKQAHADRMLQLRDRARNGRLRGVQKRSRLAHAAGLRDAHQNMQVVQLHPPPDAIADLHADPPSSRNRYDNIEEYHYAPLAIPLTFSPPH